MSERDWSRLLTEDYVTMKVHNVGEPREFCPSKPELPSPATDWVLSWSMCRQKGLSPDLSSFLWKLLHNLLCSQQRLHRMGVSPSPICKLCNTEEGTLQHELIGCHHNANIGQELLTSLKNHIPSLTEELLRLEFVNLNADLHLPVTILNAVTLSYLWKERSTGSRVHAYQVRPEMEQTIAMLRTTRLSSTAEVLRNMLEPMFM